MPQYYNIKNNSKSYLTIYDLHKLFLINKLINLTNTF
nr:MAG TPA: hypothetical protein [Ackermannviridae sp.]